MSSIRVLWQNFITAVDEHSDQQRELSTQIDSLRRVRSQLVNRGSGFYTAYRNLDQVICRLEQDQSHMSALQAGLSSVLNQYASCETAIAGQFPSLSSDGGAASGGETGGSSQPEASSDTSGWKDFWELVSKAGIVGSLSASIGGMVSGDMTASKYLLDAVGGVSSKVASGSNTRWRDVLFGLDDALSGINTSSSSNAFTSSLGKQFGSDLSFGAARTVGDKLSVATKWGGHIFTGISNFLENQEEFKGVEGSAPRMVAETVIETGVDIGLGAAATAAVTAAAVAVGITSAPAVLVGAASVGVVWAANGICKLATGGKDIGEMVADAVCDGAKVIGDGFNAVVNWGKSLFS